MAASGWAYIGLNLILMLVPGLGWALALGYKRLFVIAFTISAALPVLASFACRTLGLSFMSSLWLWGGAALIGWALALPRINQLRPTAWVIPYVVIAALWAIYSVVAGPYVDVPADFIFHTRFIESHIETIQHNSLLTGPTLTHKLNYYGHFLWATQLSWLGVEAWQVYPYMAFSNGLLFLWGIYAVGIWVYSLGRESEIVAPLLAFIATITCVFLFSVDAFSFVRYYFIAPVIQTFIGFLTAGLIGTALLRNEGKWLRDLIPLALIALFLFLSHRQELLFLIIMLGLVAGVEALRSARGAKQTLIVRTLASIFAIGAIAIWLLLLFTRSRSLISTEKVIALEQVIPFVRNLYIANPAFQFYQVMGVTGVLTLIILWLVRRDWWHNSWLAAAWLSPFLTLFNPIFVDFFLRQASEHVLWRMAFLTQLYYLFVLAMFLLVRRIAGVSGTILARGAALCGVILLLLSLIPIQTRYTDFAPNRFAGLLPVALHNAPDHWQDLWGWLDTQQPHRILTDPITGYQLVAFTPQHYEGYKFTTGLGFVEYRREDYSDLPLKSYDGAWLIVNLRDGGYSDMGARVQHWDKEALNVSRWYPQSLIRHIDNHPDHFIPIWISGDGKVRVYELVYEN